MPVTRPMCIAKHMKDDRDMRVFALKEPEMAFSAERLLVSLACVEGPLRVEERYRPHGNLTDHSISPVKATPLSKLQRG